MKRGHIPNEIMGIIIGFTGELPREGENWLVQKDGIQIELGIDEGIAIGEYDFYHEDAAVTNMIIIADSGVMQRVLQDPETGHKMLVNQIYLAAIDASAIEQEKGETEPDGLKFNATHLLMLNNVCKFEIKQRYDEWNENILKGIENVCLL